MTLLLATLVEVSNRVAQTGSRLAKRDAIAACLREADADADDIEIAVAGLSGETRHGRIGVGYATLAALRGSAAPQPALTVREVDAALERIGATAGKGSTAERNAQLRALFDALTDALPASLVIPRLVTDDIAAAEDFYAHELARGHEGVMAKALDAPYEAGSRGASWLKVKRTHTLDLVVLAAEWGHGRRRGWLSNLHLGARDRAGGWVMLGKTFKGMTDALLEWQTAELLTRETRRDGHIVHVRPELVIEIAFNDLQASSQYPGGLALRFARVKG